MIWSDGKTVLHLERFSRELRRFDENLELVARADSSQMPTEPFFVRSDTHQLYKGTGSYYPPFEVQIVDIDTLDVVDTFDTEVAAMGALDDGRLVALIADDSGPRFVVGRQEEGWELSIPMDRDTLMEDYSVEEIQTYAEDWSTFEFGAASVLRVTEHGVVISDGKAGLMALWKPGSDRFQSVWRGPGVQETELFGLALEGGVVYVSRVAGRASKVLQLVDGGRGTPVGSGEYQSAELSLMGGHLYLFDEHSKSVTLFDTESFETIASHRDLKGHSFQAGAGEGRFFVGFRDGLHVLEFDGETLQHEFVSPFDLVKLSFAEPEGVDVFDIMADSKPFRMDSGSKGKTVDGVEYVILDKVHRAQAGDLIDVLVDSYGVDRDGIKVEDD